MHPETTQQYGEQSRYATALAFRPTIKSIVGCIIVHVGRAILPECLLALRPILVIAVIAVAWRLGCLTITGCAIIVGTATLLLTLKTVVRSGKVMSAKSAKDCFVLYFFSAIRTFFS